VEIDLLRAGNLPILGDRKSDYRILISRGDRRPKADLYAFSAPQEIPRFLAAGSGDVEPVVDLQTLLRGVMTGRGITWQWTTQPTQPLVGGTCNLGRCPDTGEGTEKLMKIFSLTC